MRISDVDMRLLRVFVVIVDCGGLSAAESQLNIGRSSISVSLAELESRLGQVLCKRGRSGFKLTDAGKIVYQAAQDLFRHCDEFVSAIHELDEAPSGKLSIAAIDMLVFDPRWLLPEAFSQIRKVSEKIQFELRMCSPVDVELALLNGTAQVGIGVGRNELRGLTYENLFSENENLYCGANHQLRRQLEDNPEVALAQCDYVSRGYMRGFDTYGSRLQCRSTSVAFHEEAVLQLILSGEFVGFLPEHFAQLWCDSGHIFPVGGEEYAYTTPVVFITKSEDEHVRIVQEFKRTVLALLLDAW